jgi:leader peptidase (prepilin peptidase)/N-methyltransferase
VIGADLLPVLLGPFIGSFLLVTVLRYPGLEGAAFGRSACPSCRATLAARDLVPLLSWLFLKGRCRACAAAIGWQYPAVELAAASLALWAATTVSGWWLLWATCVLGWTLLALALIDFRCQRLPDFLTLPLLLAGLAVGAAAWPAALTDHAIGAAAGYTALAAIARLYRRVRGRDGLGLGDAKLLAAGGAWLSWQALPMVVLTAATLALVVEIIGRAARRAPLSAATRVPFGPYLASAIWLAWLYGPLELPLWPT